MPWDVEYTDPLEEWWDTLPLDEQAAIDAGGEALEDRGPALRGQREDVTTPEHEGAATSGRKHPHPVRLRPRRTAILLIGGDKTNRWDRWYDETVPIADRLYDEHLEKFGNRRRAVMSGRKNFDELRHKLRSDAGARVKVDQYRHVMKDALALADLREERRVTQQEVADKLGISQPNISRVEHQEDVYLSTLRGYVDVLGGHLEVRAVFSDQTVTLDVPASQAG
jgi:hypothetical protein